jgi:chromosome segregation ATPase
MDARTRNSSKQSDGQKDLPVDTGAEMKLPKAEDEVLGVIAGVEQQLLALRRAHAEHRQAMVELAEKRRELAEATEQVCARQAELEDRGEEIESREGELTSREVELAEMRQEVESRESEVAQRAARIEQRESKIAQQAEMLERQEAQVESRAEELEGELLSVQQERQKIEITARELQERAGAVETKAAELGEFESALLAREAEAEEKLARENAAEAKLSVVEKSLRQLEGKIKGRELELGERSRALEEMAERAGALEAELNQTRESLETALHLAEEKLTRERRVTEGLRAQMEVAEEEVRNAAESINRVSELEQLLEMAHEEVGRVRAEAKESVAAELAQAEATAAELAAERDRVAALELEIESLRGRAAQAESELGGMRAALAEAESRLEAAADPGAVEAARAEVEGLRAKLDEMAAQAARRVAEARAEAERAVAEANSAAEQRVRAVSEKAEARAKELGARAEAESKKAAALEAKLKSAEGELAAAVRSRDEMRSSLESAGVESEEAARLRDALTAAVDRISEAERDAAAAREALESLRAETQTEIGSLREDVEAKAKSLGDVERQALEIEGENRDLKAKVDELEVELEVANAAPRPNADEFQRGRRRRLARQRRILREQSGKIRRATEALRDRLEQCDQVLQKRAELAEAYHAIVEMRQKNAKREVRGGVVFGVIGMMAVLGMLGAVSWFVAGGIAPGEYAASVVMTAEAGPRQLVEEDDAAVWQSYMVGLAADPRFLEQAAERMKRRGITTLGTAGELGREARERLVVESPSPREIRLEWRGEGSDRTRRILDTYAVAMASVSNQSRARRTDGLTTVISSESTASERPLDTRRLETAGMVFGGSAGFTLLLGGFLWRRLSAAKARFERDGRIEPLMDEGRWELPTRG